jgi:hypothetical protein
MPMFVINSEMILTLFYVCTLYKCALYNGVLFSQIVLCQVISGDTHVGRVLGCVTVSTVSIREREREVSSLCLFDHLVRLPE